MHRTKARDKIFQVVTDSPAKGRMRFLEATIRSTEDGRWGVRCGKRCSKHRRSRQETGNNRVMAFGDTEMLKQIVFPSCKRCQCIKNACRRIGCYRKHGFAFPDSDVGVMTRDERHRDEVIGNSAKTQVGGKAELIASCILIRMI